MTNRIQKFTGIHKNSDVEYIEPYREVNEGSMTFFAGFGWKLERNKFGLDTIISPEGRRYFAENLFAGMENTPELKDARDIFELLFEDRIFYKGKNRVVVFGN